MCVLDSFHATGHDSDEDHEGLEGYEGYEGLNIIYPIFRMSSFAKAKVNTLWHYENRAGVWKLRGFINYISSISTSPLAEGLI